MADWSTKTGDTSGYFAGTCTLPSGSAQDITGATLKFVIRSLDTPEATGSEYTASIVSGTAGTWRIARSLLTALDTAGMYQSELQVTFSDATIMTFPNDEDLTINSLPDKS